MKAKYLSGVPPVKVLNDLAREITPFWEALGSQLKVKEGTIENILENNAQYGSPRKKAFAMLKAWRYKGSSSTYKKLAKALKHELKDFLAEKYCEADQA